MNSYESKQFYLNTYEFTLILTWFDLILFPIIPHLYEFKRIHLNLFENMHTTAALLHTAALPDSHSLPHYRTLPHTAAHCRTAAHYCKHCHTLPCTLPHTGKCTAARIRVHCCRHPCAMPYTAALLHTLVRALPHTAAHTAHTAWIKVPHTAHRTQSHTAIIMN
jgi:hypothetical protein